jgi:type VI secretion system protein VasG
MPEVEGIAKALRPQLLKVFPAALLGRIVSIPFFPLSDVMLHEIIKLQLGRIQKRISRNHKLSFTYSDDVLKLVASRCSELESGGRMIDAILTNTVLPRISQEILNRLMEGKQPKRIAIGVSGGEFSYDFD